jgi:hypothetical protein
MRLRSLTRETRLALVRTTCGKCCGVKVAHLAHFPAPERPIMNPFGRGGMSIKSWFNVESTLGD